MDGYVYYSSRNYSATRKLTSVNWVSMNIDYTIYTSTLLNINNQYTNDYYQAYVLLIFLQNMFYDNTLCLGGGFPLMVTYFFKANTN